MVKVSKVGSYSASEVLKHHLLIGATLLGINIYLRTTFEHSTTVRYTQEKINCLHMVRDIRLSDNQRQKYESTHSCPIEYFEHAHFKYETKSMGPRFKSSLLLSLDYYDKSGQFDGNNMKFGLFGQVYMVPKDTNQAVYSLPILERPINLNFDPRRRDTSSDKSKVSSLIKINQIEMSPLLDYEFKVNHFELTYDKPGSTSNYVFNEDLYLTFSLYRIDTLPDEKLENLDSLSKGISLIWFVFSFILYWINSKRFKAIAGSSSTFRFMILCLILAELPYGEKFISFMAFKYDLSIQLLRRFLLNAALGFASVFLVLQLTRGWHGIMASVARRCLILVIVGWSLLHYVVGIDMINEAAHEKNRTMLYKKINKLTNLVDITLLVLFGVTLAARLLLKASKSISASNLILSALWLSISVKLQASAIRPITDAEDLVLLRVNLVLFTYAILNLEKSNNHDDVAQKEALQPSGENKVSKKRGQKLDRHDREEEEQPLR